MGGQLNVHRSFDSASSLVNVILLPLCSLPYLLSSSNLRLFTSSSSISLNIQPLLLLQTCLFISLFPLFNCPPLPCLPFFTVIHSILTTLPSLSPLPCLSSSTSLTSIVPLSDPLSPPLPREGRQVCLLSGRRPCHMLPKLDWKLITQGLGETTPARYTPCLLRQGGWSFPSGHAKARARGERE